MSRAVEALLAGAERMALGDGRFLRLLSAQETLEARREGEALARTGREKALCSNAALLARALEGPEGPLFSHAQAALEGMTAREIGVLSAQWAAFDRAQIPLPSIRNRWKNGNGSWPGTPASGCAGGCCGPSGCFPTRSGPGA